MRFANEAELLSAGVSQWQLDEAFSRSPQSKGESPRANPPLRPARIANSRSADVVGVPVAAKEGVAVKAVRRGRMNPTESRFASEVLDRRKADGFIEGYAFEPMKLIVAHGAPGIRSSWICLDFLTWGPAGLVVYETKGWWRQRDRDKTKVAAERHGAWVRIAGVRRISGEWVYEWFS